MPRRATPLTIALILNWADEEYRRTGRWPRANSGKVKAVPRERWSAIADAVMRGTRGLRGGITLPQLLARDRGVRNKKGLAPFNVGQILNWADAHRRRTAEWPTKFSGTIVDAPAEKWAVVDDALKQGYRGLSGGQSIAKLLREHRGRRHVRYQTPLSPSQILRWADQHKHRTGKWPSNNSGPVSDVADENWTAISRALEFGRRGLPGGSTIEKFLALHRNRPYQAKGAPLAEAKILRWAKQHHQRTGRWPGRKDGHVAGAAYESWAKVNDALTKGQRGLSGKQTLLGLLVKHFGIRGSPHHLPRLTKQQILNWADAHHHRTGQWPQINTGAVHDAPGERWSQINAALYEGQRGLRGGSSLAQLLAKERGRRHKHRLPRLTSTKILAWADAHLARTGKWPSVNSGMIHEMPEERWNCIDNAMFRGSRGLPGGMHLNRFLVQRRGKYDPWNPPRLTYKQILSWADSHYRRTGDWPTRQMKSMAEAPHEQWSRVNAAMMAGGRGLPGRHSLVSLLSLHRMPEYQRKGIVLKPSQILHWAAEHHELTGRLPTRESGSVRDELGERWDAIDAALRFGSRGLRRGSSLPEFLAKHYVPAYPGIGKPLRIHQILGWIESFHQRVGSWPTPMSAYTDQTRTERWSTVDFALREGLRGLPGKSSLAKLVRTLHRTNRS